MGTWGTEVKQNTAVTQTGAHSFEFVGGEVGEVATNYIPVQTGAPYRAVAFLRGDSIAGGNTCKADIDWYTAAKVYISSTNIHATAVVGAAIDTWYEKAIIVDAPATAAFARVLVEKVAEGGGAWTMYCDYAGIAPTHPAFWAYLDADTDYNNAETVVFDVDDGTGDTYDLGSNYNAATGVFTAPAGGLYSFVSLLRFTQADVDTGEVAYGVFWKNGASVVAYGTVNAAFGLNQGLDSLLVSGPIWLNAGSTIEVKLIETHGAGAVGVRGDVGGSPYSYFGGAKVQ